MSRLRITYYAEGHRNGCKVTLHDVCGMVYDDFIIDANRWNYVVERADKKLSSWQQHASDTQR